MRRLLNNIISVCFSLIKFSTMKMFHWKDFTFSSVERFSPNVVIEFNKGSKVNFGKMIRVHSGTKIKVREGAKLDIGKNAKINYYCIIACHDSISIGEGTEFGPSVFVYDHDHDYRVGLKENKYKTSPIKIGKNCWIGANTVILRGTEIGDNCVVGAGCVISGSYNANTVIIQSRETKIRSILETKKGGGRLTDLISHNTLLYHPIWRCIA